MRSEGIAEQFRRKAYVPLTRGDTTYFRIAGAFADGTTAVMIHGAGSYGNTR
ncbi:hypothetical protein ACWEKM_13520 [Streptomyces sp. NPDC004752]